MATTIEFATNGDTVQVLRRDFCGVERPDYTVIGRMSEAEVEAAIKQLPALLADIRAKKAKARDERRKRLQQEIAQRQDELDRLSAEARKETQLCHQPVVIDASDPRLISDQVQLHIKNLFADLGSPPIGSSRGLDLPVIQPEDEKRLAEIFAHRISHSDADIQLPCDC